MSSKKLMKNSVRKVLTCVCLSGEGWVWGEFYKKVEWEQFEVEYCVAEEEGVE